MTAPTAAPADTKRDAAKHVLRGVAMGGADIVPGVSGGTVALILGVYGRLVTAVSRVDGTLLGHVKARRWRSAADYLDLRLLVPLGVGILTGVAILGSLMNTLLERHHQVTLGAFFGLIAASSLFVARLVPKWTGTAVAMVPLGALFGFLLVSLPGLDDPPDGLWYLFVCGSIGICAMILPGISGAFLLLILGVYHDIAGLIKSAVKLELATADLTKVAVFGAGLVFGILTFSKFLRWLLAVAESATLAFLCGLMLGSLRKLWPFQVELTAGQDLKFKERKFENLWIEDVPVDDRFWLTLGVAAVGAAVVIGLDIYAGRTEAEQLDEAEADAA